MSPFDRFLKAARRDDAEAGLGALSLAATAARAKISIEEARGHLDRMIREGIAYKGGDRDSYLFEVD